MNLKQYLKVVLLVVSFLSGYYLKYLQNEVKNKKELEHQISNTNDKLKENYQTDSNYENIISDINNIDNNTKIEKLNEKYINCSIPPEWVRKLKNASH